MGFAACPAATRIRVEARHGDGWLRDCEFGAISPVNFENALGKVLFSNLAFAPTIYRE
jgi:hypothetical protein